MLREEQLDYFFTICWLSHLEKRVRMENFNGPIVVGNVSYEFFSTFDDIRYLSDEVKTSYIIFLRRIGVCSVDCLAKVLCEKDTNKLRNLLRGLHLQEDVDKDGCQENLTTTKEWQERILGTDPRKYSISIRGIIQGSRHDSLVGPARFSVVERRIEEALKKTAESEESPQGGEKSEYYGKIARKTNQGNDSSRHPLGSQGLSLKAHS